MNGGWEIYDSSNDEDGLHEIYSETRERIYGLQRVASFYVEFKGGLPIHPKGGATFSFENMVMWGIK